jgi:enoyl-CoA hydratase/carnithine racemase
MTTGRRYDGPTALATGLVEATASTEDLRETAAARVRDLAGKHRPTLAAIKSTLFADAVAALVPNH